MYCYIRAPLLLPDNVMLKGAGVTQAGIIFVFENKSIALHHHDRREQRHHTCDALRCGGCDILAHYLL